MTRWQTSSLLNFLKFDKEDKDGKLNIITSIENDIKDNPPDGFKAVLLSLVAKFYLVIHMNDEAVKFLNEYRQIEAAHGGDISRHPDVLASKAFALAFCSSTLVNTKKVYSLYKGALEMKPDEVSWLFGQCLSIDKLLRDPEFQGTPEETRRELEQKLESELRRIIELDAKHFQAIIVLAKRLVIKEAFEEANDFLETAESIADESGTKFEMLGLFYQRRDASKLCKDPLQKAITFFLGALSSQKNNKSERAIYGCGKSFLQKYLSQKKTSKSKDKDKQDAQREADLKQAEDQLVKLKDSTYDPHLITLATLYSEQALRQPTVKRGEYLAKAKNVYKKMIDRNKQNPARLAELCEAYWSYSTMLNKHKEFKEEVRILKECILADKNGPDKFTVSAAVKAQDRLLEYATLECRNADKDAGATQKGKHMSLHEAFEVKKDIYCTSKDYMSAIFYIRKAIEVSDIGRYASQKENLVSIILDASEKNNDKRLLEEAMTLISEFPDDKTKIRLTHEVTLFNSLCSLYIFFNFRQSRQDSA